MYTLVIVKGYRIIIISCLYYDFVWRFVYNMTNFMMFTWYPIEPAKESGTANTTERYITDNLLMEHQVWFILYVVGHVNVAYSQI